MLKIILAFIFQSGKITKFTIGEINNNDKDSVNLFKEDLLKKIKQQINKNKVISLVNTTKTDNIQVLTNNLNQINLYLSDSQNVIEENKKYDRIVYSIIFNSGKVTKFTKHILEDEEKYHIDFDYEIQGLLEQIEEKGLFVLENKDKTDFLFILPETIDSLSVNLTKAH